MEARVPHLPKGSDKRRFGGVATHVDPASEKHVQNPAIAAPRLLRLSTGGCTVDLAKKANPCPRIEEYKQEQGRMQHNCRCMINITSWGLTNR